MPTDRLVRREPTVLAAICTRSHTALSELASSHGWTSCHEFPTPVRKDGFLATNSLLATSVLLVRAYGYVFAALPSLPPKLDDLLHPDQHPLRFSSALEQSFRPLCERRTLVVLHGHMTQPAAADVESRFTEAALANVQLADYRNFAHGRHHWLARTADDTAVLILSSPEESNVADRTAMLLPKSIPVLHLRFSAGPPGMLSAVLHSIYLGWFAAKAIGLDPGKPKVPQFGRRLYHLHAIPKSPPSAITLSDSEACAIERKSGLTIANLHLRNQLDDWRSHYRTFQKKLANAHFSGVVFDYDGTLCHSTERVTGLRREVVARLIALLQAGIIVGIATGRGKSVKKELRAQIRPIHLRKLIMVGYHNAGEIGLLDDDKVPPCDATLHDSLLEVNDTLTRNQFISRNSKLEAKGRQITLEVTRPVLVQDIRNCVSDIARSHVETNVKIVQSSHSIDILAPGVSKQSLVTAMTERLGHHQGNPEILCIGDRGRWPGNDFELLQHPFALSVDQTSQDQLTCWNLAPPGSRNVDACLYYMDHIKPESRTFRLSFLVDRRKSS